MSPAPAAGWSLPTVLLDPAPAPQRPVAVPVRPPRLRLRRLPYGTALVGLLFVTAMGGTAETGEDLFEPGSAQSRPVPVETVQIPEGGPPAEPPAVVTRTSLRPLHRPY